MTLSARRVFPCDVEWDYHNPCNTWENHVDMANHAASTLEKDRPEMYEYLLRKLRLIYNK